MKSSKPRISKKIARRMLALYAAVFLVVLALTVGLLLPAFSRIAERDTTATTGLIAGNVDSTRERMSNFLYTLTSLNELTVLLRQYRANPSDENHHKVRLYLNTFVSANETTFFAIVEDENENYITSVNYASTNLTDLVRSNENYRKLYTVNTTYHSPIYTAQLVIENPGSVRVLPFCFQSRRYLIDNVNYIVTVCLNASYLIETNSQVLKAGLDGYTVLGGRGEEIYSSDAEIWQRVEEGQLAEEFIGRSGLVHSGPDCYFYERLLDNNFIIVGYASVGTLYANFFVLLIEILVLFIIPPILYYLFMLPMHDRFLSPLKRLAGEMNSHSIGDAPPALIETGDEIEDLSHSFGNFVEKINHQADDIVRHEQEKAVTMYKLLTTQLDPHFVYNTMNIMNILARQQRAEDIIRVNNALRRILRERLNTGDSALETVETEISPLRQYMVIMEYRYRGTVSVDYDVEPGLESRRIAKNLLQPLVENAIYHGFTLDDGTVEGSISIAIYTQPPSLIIEVSDDGRGIEPGRLARL